MSLADVEERVLAREGERADAGGDTAVLAEHLECSWKVRVRFVEGSCGRFAEGSCKIRGRLGSRLV